MSKNFQPLSSGEVLSVSNESQIVIGHSTFRVSEFTAALKQLMLDNNVGGVTPETIDWLTAEGIDCDVLRFGSDGWVKGKVRLHLEFSEDAGAEVSPDPKTEAAIEFVAPVAAATSAVIAESMVSEIDNEDLGFVDDEFDFPEEAEAPTPTSNELVGAKDAVDAKDTFVQEDDDSFDDLFETDELDEIADESEDENLDDLFAEDSFDEPEAAELSIEDDDLDAEMGELDDLLNDGESDASPIAEADDDTELDAASTAQADEEELDDLFGDESLFGEEESDESGAVVEEQEDILTGLDLELEAIGEDVLDDDNSLEFDLGETEEEVEPIAEMKSLTDDSGDDLFGDTDDDDLFADVGDAAGASAGTLTLGTDDSDDDLFGDTDDDDLFADVDNAIEASESPIEETLDELDANDSDDDLFGDADDLLGDEESTEDYDAIDSSLDDLDFDDDQLLEDEDSEEDAPAASLDELLLEESDDDDLGLDNLFDEEAAAETEDLLFDDPFEEAIAENNTEASYGDSLSAFEAAGDTEISQGSSANAGDAASSFDTNGNEFSFDQSEPDFDVSMDDDVADLLLDTGGGADDEDDLTEEELPPEIDFGSTEDLGEFIDVSIMKKKINAPIMGVETASPLETDPQMTSPFDLGEDYGIGDSRDDDISLGELFESNDEEDFDFDALDDGDDPLDAVTGEEDEVSADIWELE